MRAGLDGRDRSALFCATAFDSRELYESESIEGRNAVCDRVLRYWRSRRQEGRLPSRPDIRPEDLSDVLPHLVLMDAVGDGADLRLQVRLIGTHVADFYGEITGRDIMDMSNEQAALRIYDAARHVLTNREPLLAFVEGYAPDRQHLNAYALYMPVLTRPEDDAPGKILVAVEVHLSDDAEKASDPD